MSEVVKALMESNPNWVEEMRQKLALAGNDVTNFALTQPNFNPQEHYDRSIGQWLKDAVMGGDTRTEMYARDMAQIPGATYDPPIEPAFMGMDTVTSALLPKAAMMYGKGAAKLAGSPENLNRALNQYSGGLVDLKPQLDMTAYHGSPHKFDKFSLENIGTGEGAQAYGHGLYFAENKDVAHQYQRMGMNDFDIKMNGKKINPNDSANRYVRDYLTKNEKIDTDAIADIIQADADSFKRAGHSEWRKLDNTAKRVRNAKFDTDFKIGSMYEVDIPDEYVKNFLDWDAPLSEQPKTVKQAIQKMVDEKGIKVGLLRNVRDDQKGLQTTKSLQNLIDEDATGQQLYSYLTDDVWNNLRKAGDPRAFSDTAGTKQKAVASEYLNSIGIKGIKYFDGSSRSKGEGTRNLVVFDDSIVKILKRNGEEL